MSFDNNTISQVWEKGSVVFGVDPAKFRHDQCGAWIAWSEYGNRKSVLGWEIDHIKPQSDDGSDSLSNLRPLQWENNAKTQDGRLICPITSNGNQNVRK